MKLRVEVPRRMLGVRGKVPPGVVRQGGSNHLCPQPKLMRTWPEEEEELALRLTRNSSGGASPNFRWWREAERTDERGTWRRRCAAE